MESVTGFTQGIGALILGQVIGSAAEGVTRRVDRQRKLMGDSAAAVESTNFDRVLQILVQSSILFLGVTLVEKAVPSITQDLTSLLFFELGIINSSDYLTRNIKNLYDSFMA
jgi:hypothetical protein